MKEKIINIIKFVLCIVLFLFAWNFTYLGYFAFSTITYALFALFLVIKYKIVTKNKLFVKPNINKETAKETFVKVSEYLLIGIILNLIFYLILNIVPSEILYSYRYKYLGMYGGATTVVYILLTCVFYPFFENYFIRKRLLNFKDKKLLIFNSLIISLFLGFIQVSVVYSAYIMVTSFIVSMFYVKTKNIKEATIFSGCINFIFGLLNLYYSDMKFFLLGLFLVLIFVNLIIAILKEIKYQKEQNVL